MKTRAVSMVLLMIASALAGCAGSDPDGDTGIDTDMLNEMIDENLQDFINNTTVTVNQEIHYHNNTTIVNNNDETNNEYLNTTTVEGQDVTNHYSFGGVGGENGSSSNLYLLDIQFNFSTLMPDGVELIDYRNNTIDYEFQYYDYLTNSERTDTFTISCSDYYLIGSQSANGTAYTYWENSNNYHSAWENQYNQTIAEMLQNAAYEVQETCNEDYDSGNDGSYDDLLLFQIPIPEGVAIRGDISDGQREYVWYYTDSYRSPDFSMVDYWNHPDITVMRIDDGEMMWKEYYYPNENSTNSYNGFNVEFKFETIEFHYHNMGWYGGDQDSVLSVYVGTIFPGYEYRLVVYFEMSNVVPLE